MDAAGVLGGDQLQFHRLPLLQPRFIRYPHAHTAVAEVPDAAHGQPFAVAMHQHRDIEGRAHKRMAWVLALFLLAAFGLQGGGCSLSGRVPIIRWLLAPPFTLTPPLPRTAGGQRWAR